MKIGVDYYPEHWDQSRWSRDLELMARAGIQVVRLAEFAWSLLEVADGVYDFKWLDEIMAQLETKGMKVILGTPTAAPPKWLMDLHGDIYPVDSKGIKKGFGNRHHRCHNSVNYQNHANSIVEKIARRYGDSPVLAGWQIDNELGAHDTTRCYCESCRGEFRKWLDNKYSGIEDLNKAWGTSFWSQTYRDFNEIDLPMYSTIDNPRIHGFSPGMLLDFNRFSSESVIRFMNSQIEIIKKHSSRPVTHNMMQLIMFDEVDYYKMAEKLDVAAIDNYPTPVAHRLKPHHSFEHNAALNLVQIRGLKKENFWVLEQQSGRPGWGVSFGKYNYGQIRLWTYQAIAHGADLISYFRWRACPFGAEQYWYGILDHDGVPRKKYEEIEKTGKELKRLEGSLKDSVISSDVAILMDYDNVWSHQISPHASGFTYYELISDYYTALSSLHINVDIISSGESIDEYKLVIAPALNIIDEAVVRKLESFVSGGGRVITTFLSGTRNRDNSIRTDTFPGLLRNLTGIEVVDFDPHDPQFIWRDHIELKEADSLKTYPDGSFSGHPAITCNQYGKGKTYYLGSKTGLNELQVFLESLAVETGVDRNLNNAYKNIEVIKKTKGDETYLYILNHSFDEKVIDLEGSYFELLNQKSITSELRIPGLDVAILKQERNENE